MREKILASIRDINPWTFTGIAVLFAVTLTTGLNYLFVWVDGGRYNPKIFMYATIDAVVIPLIIAPIMINAFKRVINLEQANRRLEGKIEQHQHAQEIAEHRVANLQAISDFAIECASAAADANLHELIANKLLAITGALGVSISEYDVAEKALITRFVSVSGPILSIFNNILGQNIIGFRTPLSSEAFQNIFDTRVAVAPDLNEISFGVIPKSISTVIHKTFDIGNITGLALIYGGVLWGTSLIIMRRDQQPIDRDLALALANVAAMALRRKKTEEELHASEASYRALVEMSPDAISMTDISGKIVYCNKQTAIVHGYESVDEILGANVLNFFAPEEHSSVLQKIQTASTINQIGDTPFMLVKKDGSYFPGEIRARLVPGLDGNPTGIIGITRDVTERKKAEAGLHERESILEVITFAAEQLLKSADWHTNINSILEQLGKTINATHAYIFAHHLGIQGESIYSERFEWTCSGFASVLENPESRYTPFFARSFEHYYTTLKNGEPFIGSASLFLPFEKEHFSSFGIKAILEVPLYVNGKWWGTIGFDDFVQEREWTVIEVDLLKVAANVLGAAIKRQADEDALKQELMERMRAEQALRLSEEKFSKAFHTTQVLMTIEDDKNVFVDANRAFIEAFNVEREEVVGRTASELNIFYDPADVYMLRQTLQETGFLKDFELRFRSKSNKVGIALLSSEKFHVDNVEYTLTSGLDITDRKLAESEREKLINELENKNEELEHFTYTVSHDLKSPLVTINGFLGYLEQDAASGNMERLKKDTHRIQDAVNKMQRLLSELLELSRIGRIVNPPEKVLFDDLVRDALEIIHGQIEVRGVTVQVQPNLPAVRGDRQRLIEVMQNLIDNAVKYMGDQPAPLIEIGQHGVDMERGQLIFYVRDNGVGINPQYHERIFGLFNKLDANSEGTGVGLALVKRIIEVHGGRVWVESEAGQGSTFYFTLPYASH